MTNTDVCFRAAFSNSGFLFVCFFFFHNHRSKINSSSSSGGWPLSLRGHFLCQVLLLTLSMSAKARIRLLSTKKIRTVFQPTGTTYSRETHVSLGRTLPLSSVHSRETHVSPGRTPSSSLVRTGSQAWVLFHLYCLKDVKRRTSGILASINTESVFPTHQALHRGLRKVVGVFGEWRQSGREPMVKEERTERNRTLKVAPQLDGSRRMSQQVTPENKKVKEVKTKCCNWMAGC